MDGYSTESLKVYNIVMKKLIKKLKISSSRPPVYVPLVTW